MNKVFDLIKQVFSEWSEDKATKHAAALSYYTAFSLAPILVIIIALVGLFGQGDAAQSVVMAQVEDLIGAEGRVFIQDMIANANRPATGIIATIVGVITLLFGALGVFGELQSSLNAIWEVQPKPATGLMGTLKSLVVDRLLSFAMILVIGFLLLVSLVVSAGLAVFTDYVGGLLPFSDFLLSVINLVVSMGVITVLLALLFKYVPDAKIAWKDVWLGSLVTAALFTIGKFAIGLYLGRSDVGSTFGAAGSLAILLVWIYYSAQIVFLGAEFTQVYANKYGSKIQPNENATRVTEEKRAQEGIPHKEAVAASTTDDRSSSPGTKSAGLPKLTSAAWASTSYAGSNPRLRSPHLLPPPQRQRSRRAGQIVSVALLSGMLALVTSFAQIVKDVRRSGDEDI